MKLLAPAPWEQRSDAAAMPAGGLHQPVAPTPLRVTAITASRPFARAADEDDYRPATRRSFHAPRQSPMVPWAYLLICSVTLAVLIVLVLCQRAQLIKHQYALVDLRQAKAHTLLERAELKLQIQRLSALERVDGVSRVRFGMVRPTQRLVLDLSQPLLGASLDSMVADVKRTEHP